MPNWCSNTLKMSGSTEQVDKLEKYLQHNDDDHGLLNFFIPEPLDPPNGKASDALPGWYNWRCNNWGTKWEVEVRGLKRDGNTLTMSFDSAWSPPIPVYEAMHAQGWDVVACYWEPGMGFAGEWRYGRDFYLDYRSPEEVEKYLPIADEELGIADALKEWEE